MRATARAVRDRVEGARDRALYYRDILLPLHERIVNETQLQYNAMQLGPLQLLRAREQQIKPQSLTLKRCVTTGSPEQTGPDSERSIARLDDSAGQNQGSDQNERKRRTLIVKE